MAGLYFHIPFCKRICAYCDFYRSADLRRMDACVETMHRELDARRDFLHGEAVTTRYFGGGTPSLCSPESIGALLAHADALFDSSQAIETTLEANPDDLTPAYLHALRKAGVDRLSIGVQSLDDDALRLMNRRHTASQAMRAVRDAQAAGFTNITVDLIFGIPGFGADTLRRSVEGLLGSGVQHLSAYHLTIEPLTAFGRRAARGEFIPVEDAVGEAEFLLVHELLTQAGFAHYEVSNYALSGYRARHNAAYWQGIPYLGIGPAAHSFDGASRQWNIASVAQYIDGAPARQEHLTERDHFNEYLMTRLRTAEGIDLPQIGRRFGLGRAEALQRDAAPFLRAATLRRTGDRLAIPPEKFLVSDAVIGALFEA